MTTHEPYTGRHRPNTVPSHWNHPDGRRHLVGTPGFDWFRLPDHLQVHAKPMPPVLPPGKLPATGWDEAMVPGETTGEFNVDDLRADWDPKPTGPLRLWEHSGPLPILPKPREDSAPSVWPPAVVAVAILLVAVGVWIGILTGFIPHAFELTPPAPPT